MGAIGAMKELLVRSGASSAKGGAPPAKRATASRAPAQPPQLGSGAARRGDDADDEGPDGPPVADL